MYQKNGSITAIKCFNTEILCLRYHILSTNQEYLFKDFPTIRHCLCSVNVVDELPIVNVEYLLVNDIQEKSTLFVTLGLINSSLECDISTLEIQVFAIGLNMTEYIKITEFDLPLLMDQTVKSRIDLSKIYSRCLLRQDRSTTPNDIEQGKYVMAERIQIFS
ncbi:unnamed protein product [Adineta steineri]|uniref:Uncharacterized protein n=1 Tax=Adineta steineri TaxID=433720 RepID=A0A818TEZ6_9BILA|nr:unnamed protein product [Adineta steineri]CAF3676568.1 unnamed protein product [Adineta steineri]